MPAIRNIAKVVDSFASKKDVINWHPGHMYSGMQKMMGKLNTVDCVVEVHDARIPFTGRNIEFKKHLGLIKPHILVLNKSDLADLTNWKSIKEKLVKQGDQNVILTDASGSQYSFNKRGYNYLLQQVVDLINNSDRHNRELSNDFKLMIVGIPNVGKSTLINRLRQHHLGIKGEPAETGSHAGVTRTVENKIKICSRPPIYSLDTPGVLKPGVTKDYDNAMRLALCSSISDKVLKPYILASYLIKYLNKCHNTTYHHVYELERPVEKLDEFIRLVAINNPRFYDKLATKKESPDVNRICWDFVRAFRKGLFGKVMFD